MCMMHNRMLVVCRLLGCRILALGGAPPVVWRLPPEAFSGPRRGAGGVEFGRRVAAPEPVFQYFSISQPSGRRFGKKLHVSD